MTTTTRSGRAGTRRAAAAGRTLAWVLAAALVLAAPAAAQRPAPRGPGGGGMAPGGRAMAGDGGIERMIDVALSRRDTLGLTSTQVAALEALRVDAAAEGARMREAMEAMRGQDREAARERMDSIRARVLDTRGAQRERLEEILTEEQRERLRPMLGRPGGPGEGRQGMRRGVEGRRQGALRGPRARLRGPALAPNRARGAVARGYRMGLADGLRLGAEVRRGRRPIRGSFLR